MSPQFSVGKEVQCISDPSRIGTVVEICEEHAGVQYYRVNFGPLGRPKMAEIDLRPFIPAATPYDNLVTGSIDGYQDFQRLITYQRLIRENPLRNNIFAFNASRTRFYPYQFKPLLKFLDSPKHRLLIADEVGLGKTIEAGLILTEVMARQTVQRVLVVCPANLVEKWRIELKRRFGELFQVLNANDFLNFLQEYQESPEESRIQGIISLESIRRNAVLEQLEALSPRFDLVIVDEAHHMRNFGRKQRAAGVLLGSGADAMLFLTATPIHLGNENLFSLLNILDEEEFPDFYTFDNRIRENEPIVTAQTCLGHLPPKLDEALKQASKAGDSPWIKRNPLHKELLDKLEKARQAGSDNPDRRRLLTEAQQNLAELSLIGHIFSRTRKREVHTNMAMRRAYPLKVSLTEPERKFYQAVTDYVRSESEKCTDNALIQKWILVTPQRRMASSIAAMVEFYREQLNLSDTSYSEDFQAPDDDSTEPGPQPLAVRSAEEELRAIVSEWPSNGPDSKYDKFIGMLKSLRKDEGNLKVMVFAFFKGTLRYLQRRLEDDGFKCAMITGDIPPDERTTIVERFKDDATFEILLSSKVGSEGLDFQFCNVLVNYDLPWNPMEVEQRIGRLDRIGQESPIIRIYHFWIEGTIEQRILEKLYERINVFERSIGELEMILGEELGTIERDILSKKLTPEEEETLLVQKANVIEERVRQIELLEREAAQFIGTDLYFDDEVQRIKKCRRYVTGEQMRRFLMDFIRIQCPRSRLEQDDGEELARLYPDETLRSMLSQHNEASVISKYLTRSSRGIDITFDSQMAYDHPNVDFINVLHPIPQSIVKRYAGAGGIHSNAHHVLLRTDGLVPGLYLYFIYRLNIRAAQKSTTLEIVILNQNCELACADEAAEIVFGEMVERGEEPRGVGYQVAPDLLLKGYKTASQRFLERVKAVREEVTRTNDAFVDRRLESLRASYGKNLSMKRDILDRAQQKSREAKYIRMLEGTIRRLEAELDTKTEQLERQRMVGVDHDDVAAGILEVII